MEMLQFVLSGKTAFFKKPEVNTYGYFTYGNIHRVALLGIFGAILGYGGYAQQEKASCKTTETYPEFYQKLNHLKVAITPLASKGYTHKKFQSFNNSVGYASNEQGGNLIVKEQWLENPKWKIGVLLEDDEASLLADKILNRKCTYIPYLGTNDHPADIYDTHIIKCTERSGNCQINSLFYKENAIWGDEEDAEEEVESIFKYEEYLPVGLEEHFNNYVTKPLIQTNIPVDSYEGTLYQVGTDVVAVL